MHVQAKQQQDLQKANQDLAREGRAHRMECRAHKTDLNKQCKANTQLLQRVQALRRELDLQKLKQTRVQVSHCAVPMALRFAVPTC